MLSGFHRGNLCISGTMAGIWLMRTAATPLAQRLGLTLSRSFGAAAAVQLQYDDHYYEEDEDEFHRNQHRVAPVAVSDGSMEERGVQWVFIGNPGAKKHVFAKRLSKLLEIPHISMGCLVRQDLNPRSSLYKQIASALNQGKVVPEEIIFGLLSKRLEDGYHRGETGFILDGIPRTRIQAEILDQIADIDLVVNFKCTEECLVKEHLGSSVCSHCRESIHVGNSGATSLLKLCSADAQDARKENFRKYEEQSKPLEDYYRKQNKLLDFRVAGCTGETWQGLLAALHLKT